MQIATRIKIVVIIPVLCTSSSDLDNQIEHPINDLREASAVAGNGVELHILVFANGIALYTGKYRSVKKGLNNVEIICSLHNKGFTGAVNESLIFALSKYKPHWFLIMNNDVRVDMGLFKTTLKYLKNEKNSVISGAVNSIGGGIESFGLRYFSTGLAFPETNIKVASSGPSLFCGTYFFIDNNTVAREIKSRGFVLNPLFFAYAEDLEFSLRLRLQKKKIMLLPKAMITHSGSLTAKRGSEMQLYYGYRNLLLTIFLLWDVSYIIRQVPYLLIGQWYCLLMLVSKGYWVTYLKIIKYIVHWRKEIIFLRREYEKQHALFSGF